MADDVSSACRAASYTSVHVHKGIGSAGQRGMAAKAHARRIRVRVAALTTADVAASEKNGKKEKRKDRRVSESTGNASPAEEAGTQRMMDTAQRREYLRATIEKRADKDPFLSAWCASACMGVGG
jgi:hypothetical protein